MKTPEVVEKVKQLAAEMGPATQGVPVRDHNGRFSYQDNLVGPNDPPYWAYRNAWRDRDRVREIAGLRSESVT